MHEILPKSFLVLFWLFYCWLLSHDQAVPQKNDELQCELDEIHRTHHQVPSEVRSNSDQRKIYGNATIVLSSSYYNHRLTATATT
jgi:hypothetical protein